MQGPNPNYLILPNHKYFNLIQMFMEHSNKLVFYSTLVSLTVLPGISRKYIFGKSFDYFSCLVI